MKLLLNFILSTCLFCLCISGHAFDCSKKNLIETGMSFWKKHQCPTAELEKISHCNLKANESEDEEDLPFYLGSIMLKDKFDKPELASLQMSEVDQSPSAKSTQKKEDLKSCLRKVSIYFSLKVKDVLVYGIHGLREESTSSRCQAYLKSLDDLYEDPLQSKLKFCSLLHQSPPKETLKAFCQNLKEGCFFIR